MERIRVKSEWFNDWFNSPYYHILYKNRDYNEAEGFIDTLYNYFNFNSADSIADVGCGKGRHAIYLNSKGFHVTGLDLSEKNISFAKNFENHYLKFLVHDMRDLFADGAYDYILNLFTSFGYFEDESDNVSALRSFQKALKPEGKVVIDFMNTPKIKKELVPYEEKVIDNIHFKIIKKIEKGFIFKHITFEDLGKQFDFVEKVKLIHFSDFKKYFNLSGLQIKNTFGDYQLNPYSEEKSERMIFILEKIV